MYSMEDIRVKSQLVKDVINLVLAPKGLTVEYMYLIGSYASGRANEYSDIDYLVEMKGGKRPFTYPEFDEILAINRKIDNRRIHVIYGTLEAQQSMYQKDKIKYAWREI